MEEITRVTAELFSSLITNYITRLLCYDGGTLKLNEDDYNLHHKALEIR